MKDPTRTRNLCSRSPKRIEDGVGDKCVVVESICGMAKGH